VNSPPDGDGELS